MKKRGRLFNLGVLLAVLGTAALAADRFLAARSARARLEETAADYAKAARLAGDHADFFARKGTSPHDSILKTLAREAGQKRGLNIAYLSESEREAGKGLKERQVTVRLVQATHPALVLYLDEVERGGAGARVKEIHLRPSAETTNAYEEAEVVFAKLSSAGGDR